MKRKNVTLAIAAFLMFAGASNLKAQEMDSTQSTEKRSFVNWLTETPWQVGMGMSLIDDNDDTKTIGELKSLAWSPFKFTIEKALVKGWNLQLAFSSTSYNPHNFLAIDLNGKYDFNNLIGDTKWFDPYGLVGLDYSYRDYTLTTENLIKNVSSTNKIGINAGLGANFWLYPNAGIQAQAVAKLGGNNYMSASLGLVFKIGDCPIPTCEATPKTPEAEDALQHLRGIINQ
jgi:hypothetical protein